MARVRQTVVAVVHGNDVGAGVDVEVYPYDLAAATGHKAQQLLKSWRPQPGELDDPRKVNERLHPLQTSPGNSKAPEERGARGFLARAREADIAWGRAVSGSASNSICDRDYEYEIGEVLLFDAEIDTERLEVDWSTAVPHPSIHPETVQCSNPLQRFDGVIIDPQACRDRTHLVKLKEDGTTWPFNEAGQLITGLSDQEKVDYAAADRTQIPHRGPLLVTVDFGRGNGTDARLRAEPAHSAMERGTLDELAQDEGVNFRPADLEALRLAAGDQQVRLTDSTGATVGAVYLVEADYDLHRVNGSVVFDGLGASNAVESDQTIGNLRVTELDGRLHVSTTGPRFVNPVPPVREPVRGAAFLGGGAPNNTPAVGNPFNGSNLTGVSMTYGHTARDGSAPVRGQTGSLGPASPGAGLESKRGGRQALAALHSRTVALVRQHGPTVVEATKSKLKDPAVQASLKKSMLSAVEIGLASKGGGSVKFAKAANTAMQAADMIAAARSTQPGRGAGSPGFSM